MLIGGLPGSVEAFGRRLVCSAPARKRGAAVAALVFVRIALPLPPLYSGFVARKRRLAGNVMAELKPAASSAGVPWWLVPREAEFPPGPAGRGRASGSQTPSIFSL